MNITEMDDKDNKSRTKMLIKDTAWFAFGNFGSKILSLLLIPLYTNILTKAEYGTIDIIISTASIIIPLLTLSIETAAFRFAFDNHEDQKGVYSFSVVITILSVGPLFLLYPLFRLTLSQVSGFWLYFVGIYFSNSMIGMLSSYVKGIGKSGIYATQGILYTLTFAFLNIIFLLVFKIGVVGYFLSIIISNTISFIYLILFGKLSHRFSLKSINRGQALRMLRYSLPMIPASVAWWVMISIDKYMLLYMCGTEANGIYGVAYKIPAIISVVTTFFINAWQISSIKNKDDKDISKYTSTIYKYLYIFGYFASFVLVITSKLIGSVFFAKEFFVAWTMTPCLTVGTILSVYAGFIGAQFTAVKRTDLHMKSNFVAMILNVISNYIFINSFGPAGATYGTMLSFLALLIYRSIKVKPFLSLSYSCLKMYTSIIILMGCSILTSIDFAWFYVIDIIGMLTSVIMYKSEIIELLSQLINILKRGKAKND